MLCISYDARKIQKELDIFCEFNVRVDDDLILLQELDLKAQISARKDTQQESLHRDVPSNIILLFNYEEQKNIIVLEMNHICFGPPAETAPIEFGAVWLHQKRL